MELSRADYADYDGCVSLGSYFQDLRRDCGFSRARRRGAASCRSRTSAQFGCGQQQQRQSKDDSLTRHQVYVSPAKPSIGPEELSSKTEMRGGIATLSPYDPSLLWSISASYASSGWCNHRGIVGVCRTCSNAEKRQLRISFLSVRSPLSSISVASHRSCAQLPAVQNWRAPFTFPAAFETDAYAPALAAARSA